MSNINIFAQLFIIIFDTYPMRALLINRSNVKKVTKFFNGNREKMDITVKFIEYFGDNIVFAKYYEDSDIDLKIKTYKNDYKYIKILISSNGTFNLGLLDLNGKRIGKATLYSIIKSSKDISKDVRSEISKFLDVIIARKNLIWLLYDSDTGYTFPVNNYIIKDIIINEIHNLNKSSKLQPQPSINVSASYILSYWRKYLKDNNKRPIDVWHQMIF